ncbi:ATP-dependent RNA helicase DDX25-like [Myzus persicae]|uniref:ATP-dependent RNA helicase DDX25-like n=1 Tax=Myzus persicae TaxID=13164 RepID=UPI000B9335EB|nr:ATP-dependent RNA helicase DDX25-like [Myzus persicae]
MIFFSSTYSEDAMMFANAIAPMSVILTLKHEEETLDNVRQYYVNCNNKEDKYNILMKIYLGVTIGQAMIFLSDKKNGFMVSQ